MNFAIESKPFVLVTSGMGIRESRAEEEYRRWLKAFRVNIVDFVQYSSKVPPCYRCGRHQECRIGGAYRLWGNECCNLEITPQLFSMWEDDPETVTKVEAAAKKLINVVAMSTQS